MDFLPARAQPTDVASQTRAVVGDAAGDSARVQALRGIACLLLVAFHVIGSESDSGMLVSSNSGWRAFANFFTPLRMPLFTFLSGFVYAYRPATAGHEGHFARKKLIRLWLPLMTVTTIYYLATLLVPGASGQVPLFDAWKVYVFSYEHFWFLQAILLIFAITLILERIGSLATFERYALVLAGAFVLSPIADLNHVSIMSWRQALFLAPFFLLGLGANRFSHVFREVHLLRVCASVFVITAAIHGAHMVTWSGVAHAGSVLGIVIGATGALTLIGFFPSVGVLATLGRYSFAIYLFAPFFVAATRMLLGIVHLTALELMFTACLTAGIIGPVVLDLIVGRIPLARAAMLGQR